MKSEIEFYREMQDALKVSVKIDHNEVHKIVVRDLMKKFESGSCESNEENKKAFERVLLYYLGKDDFAKYVTNGEQID